MKKKTNECDGFQTDACSRLRMQQIFDGVHWGQHFAHKHLVSFREEVATVLFTHTARTVNVDDNVKVHCYQVSCEDDNGSLNSTYARLSSRTQDSASLITDTRTQSRTPKYTQAGECTHTLSLSQKHTRTHTSTSYAYTNARKQLQ